MSSAQDWYVEYRVTSFGDVSYCQGPYDYANALLHRDDIAGYEGVHSVSLRRAGELGPEVKRL